MVVYGYESKGLPSCQDWASSILTIFKSVVENDPYVKLVVEGVEAISAAAKSLIINAIPAREMISLNYLT